MRLGAYTANLGAKTLVAHLYAWGEADVIDFPGIDEVMKTKTSSRRVSERHRHRYEVNPKYHEAYKQAGLTIAGTSAGGKLVEFIELPRAVHPYYVATQAHPEFKSRPTRPHPLFSGLIAAAVERRQPDCLVSVERAAPREAVS